MASSPPTTSSIPTTTRTDRGVDMGHWMGRGWLAAMLWLAFVAGTAHANEALEPQVAEIERLSLSEPWRESSARIEALLAQDAALSREQRQRLEYVRLRNLGIAGEMREALDGFSRLLHQDMPSGL